MENIKFTFESTKQLLYIDGALNGQIIFSKNGTLWLFNIAMGNGPLTNDFDDSPIKNCDSP